MQNAKREKELRTMTLGAGGLAGALLAVTVPMFVLGNPLWVLPGVAALILLGLSATMYIYAERADRAFQHEMDEL